MARYFPNERISQIHGQARKRDGILYFPLYHPAAALHQPSLKAIVEADVLKIPRLLDEMERMEEAVQRPQPQQLSLF
jgi:DNA polymerase